MLRMTSSSPAERRVVFISHATPQENDFATWLGARLVAAGYEIWVDQTRLIGAEVFWNDIDEAIRNRAAKVIVALSRTSVQKEGVLDEIAIAVATGRKLKDPEFVVPVRVDDLPLDEVPPELVRKNIINFAAGWGDGLVRVLKVLDRDNVPKAAIETAQLIKGFVHFHQRQADRTDATPEMLLSNWLEIRSLPAAVNFIDPNLGPAGSAGLLEAVHLPRLAYLRYIFTFAEPADMQADLPPSIALETTYRVPIEGFLAGRHSDVPAIEAPQARNMVTQLVRQAWDNEMARRGLKAHEMAHGVAWFVPAGLVEDNKARFVDISGKRRWRKLVGRSAKGGGVHWHFGVSIRSNLLLPRRLVLRPHIVFTVDGVTPIDSPLRMQRLRKSVCRAWWNDRWRDLILAFTGWLIAEEPVFTLPTGSETGITISGQTMIFTAPISLSVSEPEKPMETEDLEESEIDSAGGWDTNEDLDIDDEDDETP